jgi:hypothetical protein
MITSFRINFASGMRGVKEKDKAIRGEAQRETCIYNTYLMSLGISLQLVFRQRELIAPEIAAVANICICHFISSDDADDYLLFSSLSVVFF